MSPSSAHRNPFPVTCSGEGARLPVGAIQASLSFPSSSMNLCDALLVRRIWDPPVHSGDKGSCATKLRPPLLVERSSAPPIPLSVDRRQSKNCMHDSSRNRLTPRNRNRTTALSPNRRPAQASTALLRALLEAAECKQVLNRDASSVRRY